MWGSFYESLYDNYRGGILYCRIDLGAKNSDFPLFEMTYERPYDDRALAVPWLSDELVGNLVTL